MSPPGGDEAHPDRGRRTWGVAIALTYAALAAIVGNAYPLFNLDMFSFSVQPGQRIAGPLLVARGDGSVHRVDAFVGWRCDAPIDAIVRSTCHDDVLVAFRFRRLDHRHMTATGATPSTAEGETVRLIRPLHRTYVEAGAHDEQCEVARCRASFAGQATGFYGR